MSIINVIARSGVREVIPKMYYHKNLDRGPFEIAMRTAAGDYIGLSSFDRHMAARDYWLYVLDVPGAFPWVIDVQASEWLKQYEEIT